jgi:cyclase
MQTSRRDFMLGATAVLAGACFAPAALARARFAEDILDWQNLTEHTKAVINLALGGNSMIIASGGETLVIDSKFPYLGPILFADASASGMNVSLLNTHHHGDHTGGNSAFVGKGKTYAHPNAIERIRMQTDRYRQGAQAAMAQVTQNLKSSTLAIELAQQVAEGAVDLKADDFVPTETVDNGDVISVGELTVKIHHFGAGHTDNDLVVQLESENVIHTGDLVFAGLHPFYDPSAGVTARGWIESLNSILTLCDDETTVVPGHGAVGGKEIIENMRSYHEQLIDVVKAEIDKGTAKEEVVAMSWPFMDGLQFEQIKGRAVGAVYDEVAGE